MFELKKGLERVNDQVEHVKRKVENLECGAMSEKLQESVRNIVKDELEKENVEETLEKLESMKDLIEKQEINKLEEKCKDIENISKFMDAKAKEQELEMEDRARRQKGLIIFKLPESDKAEVSDKIKEDKERVNQILDEIGVEEKPVFMKRLFGKKDRVRRTKAGQATSNSENIEPEIKAAPFLVKFESQSVRDEVISKYIGAMKDGKEEDFEGEEERLYHTVNIQRDMTRKEREEDLKLYKELKDKREMSKNCQDERAHWVRRHGRVINIGRYPRGRMDQRDATGH